MTRAHRSLLFTWLPTDADVGEYTLVMDVSDGELHTTIEKTVVVVPAWGAHDYKRWLLLGGGPFALRPAHGPR